MLSTDIIHYVRPKPLRSLPGTFRLDATSSCPCGPIRALYDRNSPTTIRSCRVYTLSEALVGEIEVQSCSKCPGRRRRFIGPDPRSIGVFNYNNRVLVTHDLLDEYTAAFTSSETPFVAWVSVLKRRYETHGSEKPFLSNEMFRAVWFAYVNLQSFEGDMICSKCGPTPSYVIWDGVSLAFNQKHLLESLRPPTVSHANSPVQKNKYIGKQQILSDGETRRLVRTVIAGPYTNAPRDVAKAKDHISRLQKIPETFAKLQAINPSLATIFQRNFGINVSAQKPRVQYIRLFAQVCGLIGS